MNKNPQSLRTLLILLVLALCNANACADAEAGGEAAVKTAFLYNFFKFIEWPETVSNRDAFSLCTTETDALGDGLAVLEQKTVNGKPMLIRRAVSDKDLSECHMVYIGAADDADKIIAALNGLPVVTVSDQPGFINRGGMIGLVQDDNRLSFEVNLDIANAKNIHVSARLLKLAKNVNSKQ